MTEPTPKSTPASQATAAFPRQNERRLSGAVAGSVASAFPTYRSRHLLVGAILIGLTLGITSGLWLNAWWKSFAATRARAAATQLPRAPQAAEQTAPALANASANQPAAVNDTTSARALNPPVEQSGSTQFAKNATAPARAGSAAARTVARAAEQPKLEPAASTERRPDKFMRCAFSTNANALALRNGGASLLAVRLSESNPAARISVTTPNWADIVVFPEKSAGNNRLVNYSIRSVSKRTGAYKVNVKTPCGTKSIPVTVTQP